MLYIAENLKSLRKHRAWTQEEMAEMVGVAPQTVSKWERGETYPDITLLPALANLYKVSIDVIVGMDKINEDATRCQIFAQGKEYLRQGNGVAAAEVYTQALKTFPNDESILAELGLVLSFENAPEKLQQGLAILLRALEGNPREKVRHTVRGALCFVYFKLGEKDKAIAAANNLPHARESRENILAELHRSPSTEDVNAYLRFIALGEKN